MNAKDPIEQAIRWSSSPAPAPAPGWEDLRVRYRKIKADSGPGLWGTTAGRQLALDIDSLRLQIGPIHTRTAIFGAPRMLSVYWDLLNECETGARDLNLLIVGERGTGKEEVAKFLAEHLNREIQTINCATLLREIADAQLFGVAGNSGIAHVPREGSEGVVQRARGGVLFLDEIFDAEPSTLPKLLRLLQQRRYSRVAGPEERLEDTVIVAASNRHVDRRALEAAGGAGLVRLDLVDRFAGIIELPPLRERRAEIPLLADFLLQRLNRELGSTRYPFHALSPETREMFRSYPYSWPGNLRELGKFLREQGHLRIGSDRDGTLEIPREAFVAWLRDDESAPSQATSDEPMTLSAWNPVGLRRLKEQQLLAALREQIRLKNVSPRSIKEEWVTATCKELLKAGNVSQRLKDHVKKGIREIFATLLQSWPE
jgi:transcriptional regulator with AAA-type ATPase domain